MFYICFTFREAKTGTNPPCFNLSQLFMQFLFIFLYFSQFILNFYYVFIKSSKVLSFSPYFFLFCIKFSQLLIIPLNLFIICCYCAVFCLQCFECSKNTKHTQQNSENLIIIKNEIAGY